MKGFCRLWYSGISILFWYLLIIGIAAFYGSIYLLLTYQLPNMFVYTGLWILLCASYFSVGILPSIFIIILLEKKSSNYAYMFIGFSACIVLLSGLNMGNLIQYSDELADPYLWRYFSGSITTYYLETKGQDDESLFSYPSWLPEIEEKYKCCGLRGPRDYGTILPFDKNKTELPICRRIKNVKGCMDNIKSELYVYYYIMLIFSGILTLNGMLVLIVYLAHFLNFQVTPNIIKTIVQVPVDENNNLGPQDFDRLCQIQMQTEGVEI